MARRVTRAAPPTDHTLLRYPDVAKRYGLPESRIREAVRRGVFLAPLEFGPRSHYWAPANLDRWEKTEGFRQFIREAAQRKQWPKFFLAPFLAADDTVQRPGVRGKPRKKP